MQSTVKTSAFKQPLLCGEDPNYDVHIRMKCDQERRYTNLRGNRKKELFILIWEVQNSGNMGKTFEQQHKGQEGFKTKEEWKKTPG